MSSSKVILVGAIAVVFGLYSLSLYRVSGNVGSTAEVALYVSKANDNAKTGIQRALDLWARGNDSYQPIYGFSWYGHGSFPTSESFTLLDGSFSYSISVSLGGVSVSTFGYNDGKTYQMTVVSTGNFKGPNEPASFSGHQVTRTVVAQFVNSNKGSDSYPWYNITMSSVYSKINYANEKQLEGLQGYKPNLIGY